MDNPLMKRDLADSILELRSEVERRLMRNKYYVAIKKLDDLLEAIRPLEAEVIDEDAMHTHEPAALTSQPALDPPAAEPASEEIFVAGPQQTAADNGFQGHEVYQAPADVAEVPAAAQPQPAPVAPQPQPGNPPMPEGMGNVYPAMPPQQYAPQPVQPVEEVYQAAPPQPGHDQNVPDQGQPAPQQAEEIFTPRHTAAE